MSTGPVRAKAAAVKPAAKNRPAAKLTAAKKAITTLSFRELQDRFQRAILHGDDAILAEILDSPREKRAVLLGVYRTAYVLRLIEFLMNDYEKLFAYLGEEEFDALARAYIAANPSRHPNARWYGAKLPDFLAETQPYSAHPELAGLAGLECALNDVFDAASIPPLGLEEVTRIAPGDWPHLSFRPHPATRRLDLAANASAIWLALNNDEDPPEAAALEDVDRLIIYRPEFSAMFRPMPYEEAMMWNEAAKGVPFGILCEMVATYGGEDGAPARAAGYLKGWIETGLLAGQLRLE